MKPNRVAIALALALALALSVSACAGPPPPPPPPPKQTVVDGFYRGTSTRFQAGNRQCPRPGLVTVQMWDRRFQYRWAYQVYVDAEVLDDGTVRGQGPGSSLLGRYADKKMEGDVTNGDCGLHFTVMLRE